MTTSISRGAVDASARTTVRPPPIQSTVVRALLFVSGAGALAFQTLWIKQLTLVVGVEVQAVAIGVASFFVGLAGGAAVLGRWVDAGGRPQRWYALLEAGIAFLGFAVTLLIPRSAAAFVTLHENVGAAAWLLPFLLVAAPAFLMGGTLPAAGRWQVRSDAQLGREVGSLYAWNTAGAIVGALLGPFVLVPAFGVRGTGAAVALACLAAAVVALRSGGRTAADGLQRTADRARAVPDAPPASLGLLLYACAGAVALGYEVIWTQIVAPFTSTRGAAFALVLGVYLAGLALGSALWARFADRSADRWSSFGLLIAGAGVLAILSYLALGEWLPRWQAQVGGAASRLTGSHAFGMYVRFLVAATIVVLPATLALGAAFPAAVRLTGHPDAPATSVGRVNAWNSAGAIAGTMLVGFVLVPTVGMARTLMLLVLLSCLIGAAAVLRSGWPRARSIKVAATLLLAVGGMSMLVPTDKLGRLLAATRGGTLEYYAEGAGGAVAVIAQSTPAGPFRRLYISGVSNSGDSMASLRYMRLQALLPLLIHAGQPRAAMVIALGTGITCGALLADPGLERRTCVELLPEVVTAAARFQGNYGVTGDARADIRLGDGRHELMRSEETWDLITLEPPPPSAAGVVNLYSREFYELARRRLAPGGMVAQWWPLPTQNLEDSKSLVRSFIDVFPYISVWTTEVHEMLLVGSMQPMPVDARRISERFERPGVAAALREVGVESAAALVATWVTDRDGLVAFAGDAPPVTDDRPRIEVAPWLRPGEMARVLPAVLEATTDPPLQNASDDFAAAVDSHRGELGLLFRALQASLEGDAMVERESLRRLRIAAPENAYYAWIAPVAR